ncbi:MAG TPA: hypothetical protein VFK46_07305 [Candidatus Macondimonas sp.]|nr:hypothetical protein [Candidatus Macondimonas sp.]
MFRYDAAEQENDHLMCIMAIILPCDNQAKAQATDWKVNFSFGANIA